MSRTIRVTNGNMALAWAGVKNLFFGCLPAMLASSSVSFPGFWGVWNDSRWRAGGGRGRRRLRGLGRRRGLDPDRLGNELGRRDGRRVQSRLTPGDLQRQFRVIDDAAVAAVTADVVVGAHVDAIDRAGIDAQRAEHALGVVDLEARDDEALGRRLGPLLLDVDAIDRAGAGALVTADAGGQVEAVEATVARLDRHRQFGELEALSEGFAAVSLEEVP